MNHYYLETTGRQDESNSSHESENIIHTFNTFRGPEVSLIEKVDECLNDVGRILGKRDARIFVSGSVRAHETKQRTQRQDDRLVNLHLPDKTKQSYRIIREVT